MTNSPRNLNGIPDEPIETLEDTEPVELEDLGEPTDADMAAADQHFDQSQSQPEP